MTSVTEETVCTSLHYPRDSMNSHSPTDPLSVIDPLECLRDPLGVAEGYFDDPWGRGSGEQKVFVLARLTRVNTQDRLHVFTVHQR